jgi:hypothetical protein
MSAVRRTFSMPSTSVGSISLRPAKRAPSPAMNPVERVRARPGASAVASLFLRAAGAGAVGFSTGRVGVGATAGVGKGRTPLPHARRRLLDGEGGRRRDGGRGEGEDVGAARACHRSGRRGRGGSGARTRRSERRGRGLGLRRLGHGRGLARGRELAFRRELALGFGPLGLGLERTRAPAGQPAGGPTLSGLLDLAQAPRAGAPEEEIAEDAGAEDAARDAEQLVELGRAHPESRVHGGWDTSTKRARFPPNQSRPSPTENEEKLPFSRACRSLVYKYQPQVLKESLR